MKLKFRGWHKELKFMATIHSIRLSDPHLYDLNYGDNKFLIAPENQIELMQWTGLVDKNGKELYEGDVIVFYPPWGCHAHLVERNTTNHNLVLTELYTRTIDPDEYQDLDEINSECGIIEANRWECPEVLIGYEDDKPSEV